MLGFLLAGTLLASATEGAAKNSILDLTCQNLDGARIVSQENAPVYLGFFGSRFSNESINNQFSDFGSEFASNSIRNRFSRYGSSTGNESALNPFALRPPLIVRDGYVLGILTTNRFATASGYGNAPTVTLAEIDATCSFLSSQPQLFFSRSTGAGGLDTSFSGFWWNPARSGEGLLMEFGELGGRPFLFVIFFSYDPTTRTPVFIAGGDFYDRSSSAPIAFDVNLTTGGRFGPTFNPNEVSRPIWGRFTVTVNGCNSVMLDYASTLPTYGSGSIALQRFLDRDRFTTCP